MEEVKITGNLIEEKIWSKIPILVKPVPLRPQPWRKPSKPLQKLPTIPENDQILTEENLNGDHNNFNELQPNIEQEMRNKFKRYVYVVSSLDSLLIFSLLFICCIFKIH